MGIRLQTNVRKADDKNIRIYHQLIKFFRAAVDIIGV